EPQTIDSATLTGPDVGEFQVRSDGCSEALLAPGSSCAVAIRFSPDSSGPKTATLRLRGAGGATLGRLSGEGVAAGVSAATATSRGRVVLVLRTQLRAATGRATIGRARCESTEPCALRDGGLDSGTIATAAGLRPANRGIGVTRLTLAPGTSAAITTVLPN